MSVTIKDVAKEANVSPSTVSRVIADNPRISDETKKRVFEAMKKLKYHPNAIARSLANNETRNLGLIIPNEEEDLFKNPFFIQAMRGISVYAQKKNYYIMYAFSSNEDEEVKFIKDYTNSKLVDGIILLTIRQNDKCVKHLNSINFPFVIIGRPEIDEKVLWVDNDNFKAMYEVTNKLILKGYKKIAFVGGPKDRNMSKDRLNGYKRALESHGLVVNDDMIVEAQYFTEECGYNSMEKILKSDMPDSVVTTDDLLAFGVIEKIKQKKDFKIPVIGFNNTPLAIHKNPKLTSVDINAELLGYKAAELLIKKLKNEKLNVDHYIVDTFLVERESTEV